MSGTFVGSWDFWVNKGKRDLNLFGRLRFS